jgi:hypothetical protein
MPRVKVFGILRSVLAATLGLLPVAPPEHMHEAKEEGHQHVVIHRHVRPHALLDRHDHHDADHPANFDDDDGPVRTITVVYNVPAPRVVIDPPTIAGTVVEPLAAPCVARPLDDVESLIHGPPRAPAFLRAPPSFPAA